MKVGDICSSLVISVPRSACVADAAALMKRHQVGALLVTADDGASGVGIVTDRDLVLHALAVSASPGSVAVEQVMSREPACVSREADLRQALAVMREGAFRRLGVKDAAGNIVGLLSLDDVMQVIASDLVSVANLLATAREREHASAMALASGT
jgi:CBS domain-containing protein